jgi:hypothetical protein
VNILGEKSFKSFEIALGKVTFFDAAVIFLFSATS